MAPIHGYGAIFHIGEQKDLQFLKRTASSGAVTNINRQQRSSDQYQPPAAEQ